MQNRLTLMCGPARSGKSTWIKENAKDDVIVCPDRIRKLIFGHQFHRDAEDFVWAYAKGMAKLILEQGKNVLIDATNLNYSTREQWYRIALDYKANIRVVWVKTSLKECKERNRKSPEGERLPEDVLERMAIMFENPTEDIKYDVARIELARIELVETPYKGRYTKCSNIYQKEVV
jgi:predicted kinase